MVQFTGTHANRLDGKGRVSIPAEFRAAMKEAGVTKLLLRASHQFTCIEGRTPDAFARMAGATETLDAFSDEHADMTLLLYSGASTVAPDGDGRIVLSPELASYAGLGETAMFAGAGNRFEIWEPAAFARRKEEMLRNVLARRQTLPGSPRQATGAAP